MSIQVLRIQNFAKDLKSYVSRRPPGQEDLWRHQTHKLHHIPRRIPHRSQTNRRMAQIQKAEALNALISTMYHPGQLVQIGSCHPQLPLFNLHAGILWAIILVCLFLLQPPPNIKLCPENLSDAASESPTGNEFHHSEDQQPPFLTRSLHCKLNIYCEKTILKR